VSTRQTGYLNIDDGYEDFYQMFLPILKKYNIRVTIYVITGFIGNKLHESARTSRCGI